jgi:hypothetical protein
MILRAVAILMYDFVLLNVINANLNFHRSWRRIEVFLNIGK